MRQIVLALVITVLFASSVMAATLTYVTTAAEDAAVAWELARRATASTTPPKDGQALLTIEFGHLLRTWAADRKAAVLRKVQDAPATVTAEDKALLGIK